MIRTVVSCDACGTDKKETNHWWVLWIDEAGFHADRLRTVEGDLPVKHACGSGCANKMFMRWMATGKMEAEKPTPSKVRLLDELEDRVVEPPPPNPVYEEVSVGGGNDSSISDEDIPF